VYYTITQHKTQNINIKPTPMSINGRYSADFKVSRTTRYSKLQSRKVYDTKIQDTKLINLKVSIMPIKGKNKTKQFLRRKQTMGAKKKETVVTQIEPIKETRMIVELIGDTDLILHKLTRGFTRQEIYKQSHEKGTEMPNELVVPKNAKWEALITSLTWEKPITFHDDDLMAYTEEEWKYYMENNRPCILGTAFYKSFMEIFTTFFKEKTGKNGTDFRRSINIVRELNPITFSGVNAEEKLANTGGISNCNVLCRQNVFSGWKCEIEIVSADCVFPYSTVLSVIQTTGSYNGIGSQRKNGYGRYHIGEVKIL
jgi:hypothetical protein